MGLGTKYRAAVSELVNDVLAEDPVDLGMLSIDETVAKDMMVSSMCELYDSIMTEAETPEDGAIVVMSIMSKLAFENFVLHAQQLNSAK